jgi:hypothetical protein
MIDKAPNELIHHSIYGIKHPTIRKTKRKTHKGTHMIKEII